VFWFTSFLSEETEELSEYLYKGGVQTRRFFYPLHLQPCYKHTGLVRKTAEDGYPVSKRVYDKGISLPSSFLLSNEDQMKVIDDIRRFYENRD
jgi:perosamine synthetase